MPSYNVEHSFPLTLQQKSDLAERITYLHSRTFTTPSMFVQVKYYQYDASAHNHFVGGKPKDETTNRIIGFVRSSAERKKEHFDKLAEQIENAWYIALGERTDDDEEGEQKDKKDKKETPQREKAAKELLSISFVGGLVGREKGFVIPEAGKEEAWVKSHRKDFEEQAELGDEEFKAMLEEIDTRDDLKNWRA